MIFGHISRHDGYWHITCDAHVRTKLKRLFPEVDQRAGETIRLSNSAENCRDLLWFIDRYPMKVDQLKQLKHGAKQHIEQEDAVTALLERRHPPSDFTLAVPAREYQVTAASLATIKRGLLVADDVGLGKTVTAICPMGKSEHLPVLVVTLTHLPGQWKAELARFAPQLQVHVLKSGKPYDLVPKHGRQASLLHEPRLPDVIISNYHKLHGWAEVLRGLVRYIVFDEVQDLRRSDSNKYAAACHIAEKAVMRVGLSVGPKSDLVLIGGPFGRGWIGPIEHAWQLLGNEPVVLQNEYELIRVEHLGIVSRGWDAAGFAWKPVKTFIRHRCTKSVKVLKTGGASLVVTNDHSVYEVHAGGLSSKISDAVVVGDLLAADNGSGWGDDGATEVHVDVLSVAAGIPQSQVVVDLANVSRRQVGLAAWEWQNCRREAVYGPRLPITLYLKHRDTLPQPTAVYVGRGKAPVLPPKMKLSDWAYVLGFYLGDGWVTRDRINFAVESDHVPTLCGALEALGVGLRPLVRKMPGASVEVRCSNRLVAALILQVIGGAKCFEKRIPAEWITTWPREARRRLLDGLVDSDGHVAKRERSRLHGFFTTTSQRLALDVQALLRSLGVTGGLHVRRPTNGGEIAGRRIVGKRDTYQVYWSYWALTGDSSGRRGKRSRYAWTKMVLNEAPLRSITDTDTPEYVYDLEVVGHPSFTANGLLVHNSATPIYNYGAEFFNVIDVLLPGVLGTNDEFVREWCRQEDSIADPKAFGEYLRREGIMIRRTRVEVGRELPPVTKIPQVVDVDSNALERIKGSAVDLAKIILAAQQNYRGEKFRAAEEFNVLMRQATGIAKAPYVAEFVRLLLESGEKVVLYGWHRECYGIWMEQLKEYRPRLYTGTESPKQKDEAKQAFIYGDCRLLIISLRAGAGLDGLQSICRTVVFGELDWSPGVHEQCVGRVARDGQQQPVMAYYLISEEGADPIMADVLGVKRGQIEGVRDPHGALIEQLDTESGNVKRLAKAYLERHGIETEARAIEADSDASVIAEMAAP